MNQLQHDYIEQIAQAFPSPYVVEHHERPQGVIVEIVIYDHRRHSQRIVLMKPDGRILGDEPIKRR